MALASSMRVRVQPITGTTSASLNETKVSENSILSEIFIVEVHACSTVHVCLFDLKVIVCLSIGGKVSY